MESSFEPGWIKSSFPTALASLGAEMASGPEIGAASLAEGPYCFGSDTTGWTCRNLVSTCWHGALIQAFGGSELNGHGRLRCNILVLVSQARWPSTSD
jgi:hypothetical protein